MMPRICTSCDPPHITRDWYVVADYPKTLPGKPGPKNGDIECREAHELRIIRETRGEHLPKREEDKAT